MAGRAVGEVDVSGPLPEHPVLRAAALEVERIGRVAEIHDAQWRIVYISRELCRVAGVQDCVERFYGMTTVRRELEHPDVWGSDPATQRAWWRSEVPYMRHTLEVGTPEFEDAFGPAAEAAARIEPRRPPPVWSNRSSFPKLREVAYTSEQALLSVRLDDDRGRFVGALRVSWPDLPGSVTGLLSRGDVRMYERMARLSEPDRRAAAVLFVDLERSGELSRTLPSRAYFRLIRELTTAVDAAIVAHEGIVGKHAGDGASAFFLVDDLGSESSAARAAIATARRIRDGARDIDQGREPVHVNSGVHWGATLVMGQVVTGGRLEVTALGDGVNETARIQDVASGGRILASKDLVERLSPRDAEALAVDPEGVAYRLLGALEGVSPKAMRDAGSIPVVEL